MASRPASRELMRAGGEWRSHWAGEAPKLLYKDFLEEHVFDLDRLRSQVDAVKQFLA